MAVLGIAPAHDVITTKITWNREIVRIVNARCASCHKPNGSAFSLMSYNDGRPWAKAIQEEVLERRMPPWGAVKGFGEFRDDQSLTPEQMELIADWVEGGAPEGEDKDLPAPPKFDQPAAAPQNHHQQAVSGDWKLTKPMKLAGLIPRKVAPGESFQVMAEMPDGSLQPLLWLQPYKASYGHPFLLRTPLALPVGAFIRGIPMDAIVALLSSP